MHDRAQPVNIAFLRQWPEVAPDDEKPDFGEQRTAKPGKMFRYAPAAG
jgi:hypothetical protein